jgi:hypothetical protein
MGELGTKVKKNIKISFPYDWPLSRQTEGFKGECGNYKFYINEDLDEGFYAWFVFNSLSFQIEKAQAISNHIYLIAPEPYPVQNYSRRFTNQFNSVITSQREMIHENKLLSHVPTPWFINKSYDELIAMSPIFKTKKISVITSNKLITEGHKRRFEFVMKLKDYFNEEIDLFGRGVNDFEDKWDVLSPYQYSIAIENGFHVDYFTEKITDCFLSYTFPLYSGCTNINRYFDEKSYEIIDMTNLNKALRQIETIITSDTHYDEHLNNIIHARSLCLDSYNIFPFISNFLDDLPLSENTPVVNVLRNKFYDFSTIIELLKYRGVRYIKNKFSLYGNNFTSGLLEK